MPRTKRHWVSQKAGSFHIISRTTGQDILLHEIRGQAKSVTSWESLPVVAAVGFHFL